MVWRMCLRIGPLYVRRRSATRYRLPLPLVPTPHRFQVRGGSTAPRRQYRIFRHRTCEVSSFVRRVGTMAGRLFLPTVRFEPGSHATSRGRVSGPCLPARSTIPVHSIQSGRAVVTYSRALDGIGVISAPKWRHTNDTFELSRSFEPLSKLSQGPNKGRTLAPRVLRRAIKFSYHRPTPAHQCFRARVAIKLGTYRSKANLGVG
ncbi:hypothetical protein BJ928_1172 [Rhizobium sp. WW_1]|nr:hypothetical protein BJ928_1172 [Rhizobium sp. WW_1]